MRNLLPDQAAYPYAAAQHLFEKLPAGDGRRVIVFGRARTALAAMKEQRVCESFETSKGTIKPGSRQSIELFRLAAALRELAPKQLDDLEERYPDLKAAVRKFPGGREAADPRLITRTEQSGDGNNASFTGVSTQDRCSTSRLRTDRHHAG